MKKVNFILLVLFTISQLTITSCDKEDDEPTPTLYGSWVRDHSELLRIKYVFNPDLTGKLEDIDPKTNKAIESFAYTYSFDEDEIFIDWGHGGYLTILTYRISENTLTLEEEHGSGNFRDFTRQ